MARQLIVDGMNGELQASNETYQYNGTTYTGAVFTIVLNAL